MSQFFKPLRALIARLNFERIVACCNQNHRAGAPIRCRDKAVANAGGHCFVAQAVAMGRHDDRVLPALRRHALPETALAVLPRLRRERAPKQKIARTKPPCPKLIDVDESGRIDKIELFEARIGDFDLECEQTDGGRKRKTAWVASQSPVAVMPINSAVEA